MARFDNAYSRAITILKVLLPLVALAILSTLFLLSRPAPVGEPLPFSELALGELARDQRLSEPVYTTVTEDGADLRLSAEFLTPDLDQPGIANGENLLARITQPDGYSFDISGTKGTLDDRNRRAEMFDGVRIDTVDGYVITAPEAWLRTNLSYLESTGPIEAEGPIGRLTAGGLTIRADEDSGSNAVAVFHSGVKLIYLPQRAGQP